MLLKAGVYFFKTPKYIYVRDTTTRMDYLFNDIAYDILSYLKDHDCDFQCLYEYLSERFSIDNAEKARKEILSFVNSLRQKRIIVDKDNNYIQKKQRVKDIVKQDCSSNHQLMFATLELTYCCNERCIHCYVDDEISVENELQLSEYKLVIDQLKELGCISVLLTGGECTLRKDFIDIAAYIVQEGMLLDVFTNGYFVDDEMIDKLVALRPNSISFSLYAGTADAHDTITGIKGSFERSLRTLMLFKCAGIDTYIKSVVMKQNFSEVESLTRLAKRMRVELLLGMQITESHCGKEANQFRLLCEQDYLRVFEVEMEHYPHHLARPSRHERTTICATGQNQLSIDPYGNIYPCNAYPVSIGNIKNVSIESVWNASPLLSELQRYTYDDLSPKCKSCKHKPWCFVCMGAALRENNRLAPCSDTCMLARASHRIFDMKGGEIYG